MKINGERLGLAPGRKKTAFIMCNPENPENATRQTEKAISNLSGVYDILTIEQYYCPDTMILGIAVENVADCDMVYLCKGWQMNRCSLAVFEVARIYNKTIIFED